MENKKNVDVVELMTQILTEEIMGVEQNYVSLYDYLGRAAGNKLGEQVFNFSKKRNIKVRYREITNITYTGKVMLYPVSFLQEYFMLREEYKQYKQYFE